MANEVQNRAEATAINNTGDQAAATNSREALSQLALTLYQCKDGSLVPNPRACRSTADSLPGLTIG